MNDTIIVLLDDGLRVGVLMDPSQKDFGLEIYNRSLEMPIRAFLKNLETKRPKMRREIETPDGKAIAFVEISSDDPEYPQALVESFGAEGFVARSIPAGLKKLVLLFNGEDFSIEDREAVWPRLGNMNTEDAERFLKSEAELTELAGDLRRNREDWDHALMVKTEQLLKEIDS